MDRGRRPVGADVTKLYLAWLIRNNNNNDDIDKENFTFFEFLFLRFLELSGLEMT